MFTYFFIFSLLSCVTFVFPKQTSQKIFLFIVCVFFVFFAGTRFDVGCDFWGYLQRFNNVDVNSDPFIGFTMEEPAFQFITRYVKTSNWSYMWLNFICTVIIFHLVYRFAKRHPEPLTFILLLFPIFIVQLSMSGLRQALAVSFLLVALISFIRINRINVVIWILIGSTFHQSVLIFLPLALICGKEVNIKKIIFALLLLGPVASILLADRMSVYNDRYVAQIYGGSESSGAILRLGLIIISAALFEFYKENIKEHFPNEFPMLRLFSLISFSLIPVAFISSIAVHRLGYYVIPVQMYMISLLPFIMKGQRDRLLFKILPIVSLGLYLVVWFSFSKHANLCYVPYDSYMFN